MLATTLKIVRSGLEADPTVSPSDRTRLIALLRNGQTTPEEEPATERVPRIIRRAEAANRLACSLRLVDRLAADGILTKRKLPGRVRAAGFLESDLNALLVCQQAEASV